MMCLQPVEVESLVQRSYCHDIPAPGETFMVESSVGKNVSTFIFFYALSHVFARM